jgi:MoaA/NifB/PqqE/SkfB family radical SAM enzyme
MAVTDVTVDNLYVNISMRCNQECRRCYHHRELSPTLDMSLETALAATDLYLRCRNPRADNSFVMLFGGEPLCNWPVCEAYITHLHERARLLPFQVMLFTNGLDLRAERSAFCHEHDVHLVISLNGPYRTHRRHRPLSRALFDCLVSNIAAALEAAAPHVTAYCVASEDELAELGENLRFICGLGFHRIALSKDFSQQWQPASRERLTEILTDVHADTGALFDSFPEAISECATCQPTNLAVYPDGELYDLCHLCATVLRQDRKTADDRRALFHFGTLGRVDRLRLDVAAKRAFIHAHASCPTGAVYGASSALANLAATSLPMR